MKGEKLRRWDCKGQRCLFSSGHEGALPILRHFRILGQYTDAKYTPKRYMWKSGTYQRRLFLGAAWVCSLLGDFFNVILCVSGRNLTPIELSVLRQFLIWPSFHSQCFSFPLSILSHSMSLFSFDGCRWSHRDGLSVICDSGFSLR